MKVTTLNLALKRLFYILVSAIVTGVIAYVSKDYADMAWTPVVYFLLTTLRDWLDKSIPNK